jgi:hypothetical protein
MNTDFNKLCTPARLYFAFSVLSCIIMLFNRMSILVVFSKLIFAFLWAFILGWLCSKGYESLSWFLVLLPFVMMLLVAFGIMKHIREIDQLNPMKI